jgi:ribosomal protein S18 acetylase RimI-like enzyme
MSFGVLEEYRKIKDEKSGMNIPDHLMRKVFDHFAERNKQGFFLMVLKTNTNRHQILSKNITELL